jgi:hypothetical protein
MAIRYIVKNNNSKMVNLYIKGTIVPFLIIYINFTVNHTNIPIFFAIQTISFTIYLLFHETHLPMGKI